MTPAAPTAPWRKVCEQYFSRLMEDLEQQVESEVDSRVTAAMEAAVHGAVADAVGESRRALAEELNQSVRRVRKTANPDELYSTLLDATVPFCEQAAIFSLHGTVVHAERMRRPAGAGEDAAAASLPALEFSVSEAAAFSTVLDTRDPVIAASTSAEISPALAHLFGNQPDERVFLFPLMAGGTMGGLFCAATHVQPPPLELLAEVAGLQLRSFAADAAESLAATNPPIAPATKPKSPDQLVVISGHARNQPETGGGLPAPTGAHQEWRELSRDEQQKHLAAQRFARMRVAEMRLGEAGAVRRGQMTRDLYGALRASIDPAREQFREKHMTVSSTMVDYFHLELVRSLAHDDPILLGPNYPGPLA